LKVVDSKVTRPGGGRKRLTIVARARQGSPLEGVSVELVYDAYDAYPVIRKSVRIINGGRRWLKIDQLMIDDITLAEKYGNATPLTPSERGAVSSIIALGTADRSAGVIAVSEIPSALRANYPNGSMGYVPALFEWVIGPSESFGSEPVFQFAYYGKVQETISGVSTPLDRVVERPFKKFLARHVGLASDSGPTYSPLWASWSNFGPKLHNHYPNVAKLKPIRFQFTVNHYNIPPNDYSGAGPPKMPFDPHAKAWDLDPRATREQLVRGCSHARQRFFDHRGLPLQCLEYYAAAAVNVRGSLTPQVQDRQICSWLMGSPSVFAGDLASLSDENIARYRRLFDIVKRLQRDYDIYRHFQYSGMPEPTDTDWHWWGKLNDDGYGAVVVLRGSGGDTQRSMNIPWTVAGHKYRVVGLIGGHQYGTFTAEQLQSGAIRVTLPKLGQEILELAKE